ncbi:hypothetical protein POX_e07273 [Penicillium oxalicum]|uniref:hypothetical protein n=1 Tax=Penicillium oxalicum TaxID=69781 RepID=UPI0020B7BCD8|nr:hypothetical protein POX_e07273 [Penicillium oxalicum]KAI2789243.1 hypothetical protein POX_e07273 [Penicillium oxalicum]
MASSTAEPRFAEGEDAAQLGPDMQSLLQQQGWALDADGMGITKTFHFKTYFKAVRIGSVDVHWTTHHPRGLTQKDITLARHCDQGATLMGAVEAGDGMKCGSKP